MAAFDPFLQLEVSLATGPKLALEENKEDRCCEAEKPAEGCEVECRFWRAQSAQTAHDCRPSYTPEEHDCSIEDSGRANVVSESKLHCREKEGPRNCEP